jgi:ribonuclease E
MIKRMLIDASHREETRVVVVDGQKVEEFDFESATKRPLKGNIYLAKVTRVEPSLQAAFVEYGGNRQGFLAFAEIHPDYYQIPIADRLALLAEQEAEARRRADEDVEAVDIASVPAQESAAEAAALSLKADVQTDGHALDASQDFESTSELSGPIQPEQEPDMDAMDGEMPADALAPSALPTDDIEEAVEERGEDQGSQMKLRAPRPQQRWTRKRHYKIQEVIKRRQVILVQVVKEERGNKGAALTTYLSLAGRYCVLMPNTPRGGGISRKITSVTDRNRLKSAAQSLELPEGMGLIIRTAGENRTKAEIKRDYEYLLRMWDTIRELTLKSNAPACVYEEGDLIKRAIRDLYNKDVAEILVEGDDGYRNAKEFMRMLMPSHAKNVKQCKESVPLFQRYQVEAQLDAMFMPTVTLKSGGYIVINQTEALVSIDVNSGKATREHSIEDTAYKTNLEAAEEIGRQLRLRDLAGLIVIDFIDMEDTRNDRNVEKRLRDCIKSDRARVQIGKISQFGLLEMSRQRLRAGIVAGSTIPCPYCGGQGIVRSVESTTLRLLRGLEEEAQRQRAATLNVRAPTDVAIYALNQKRREIAHIESGYGIGIQFEPSAAAMAGTFEIDRIGGRPPEERTKASAVETLPVPTEIITPPEVGDVSLEAAASEEPQRPLELQTSVQNGSKRRRRRRRGRDRERAEAVTLQSANRTEALHGAPPRPEERPVATKPQSATPVNEVHTSGDAATPRKRRRRRRGRRGARDNGQAPAHEFSVAQPDATHLTDDHEAEASSMNSGAHIAPIAPAFAAPHVTPNAPSEPVWSLAAADLPTERSVETRPVEEPVRELAIKEQKAEEAEPPAEPRPSPGATKGLVAAAFPRRINSVQEPPAAPSPWAPGSGRAAQTPF